MTPDQYIFQQASGLARSTALLLPRAARDDVVLLYSFIRTASNYVDAVPQQRNAFRSLVAAWQQYRGTPTSEQQPHQNDTLNVRVTKNICRLMHKYEFEPSWIDAFLHSKDLDTRRKMYHNLDDTLLYVHGSAEVVGLMATRIMRLPEKTMDTAALQGRAFQWATFIRDISQDIERGRQYFPSSDLQKFDLTDLGELTARSHPEAFREFARFQLGRYQEWQREADQDLMRIPKRYRLPVQAAADSYRWMSRQIAKEPFIVYRRKIVPTKARIIGSALSHVLD